MTNAKPITQIRLGSVRASIWENLTSSGSRYNVTVGRVYQKDGEWKTSSSFGQEEVLVLCKALDMAYLWIAEHKASRAGSGGANCEAEPLENGPNPFEQDEPSADEEPQQAPGAATVARAKVR